jgi:cell division septum initiation protein DivIVA
MDEFLDLDEVSATGVASATAASILRAARSRHDELLVESTQSEVDSVRAQAQSYMQTVRDEADADAARTREDASRHRDSMLTANEQERRRARSIVAEASELHGRVTASLMEARSQLDPAILRSSDIEAG